VYFGKSIEIYRTTKIVKNELFKNLGVAGLGDFRALELET